MGIQKQGNMMHDKDSHRFGNSGLESGPRLTLSRFLQAPNGDPAFALVHLLSVWE